MVRFAVVLFKLRGADLFYTDLLLRQSETFNWKKFYLNGVYSPAA